MIVRAQRQPAIGGSISTHDRRTAADVVDRAGDTASGAGPDRGAASATEIYDRLPGSPCGENGAVPGWSVAWAPHDASLSMPATPWAWGDSMPRRR